MEYQTELKRLENIEKLRGMIEKIRIAMLTTYSATEGFHSRPMGTAQLDVEGNLWFFTNEFSPKVQEISLDNKVSVTYSDIANNIYINVTGVAAVVNDIPKMQQLWNPYLEVFFPDGINDPNLALLRVDTESAEFWDNSGSKLVVVFKMLKAALTGQKYHPGEHDKVDL